MWDHYIEGSFHNLFSFLNLPIWANFVDPTDLSPYLLLLPTTTSLEQTSSIGWTQPHPQPQPSHAAMIVVEVS